MPATYEPIATTTLGSTSTTITFSSIPATYTDLRLITVTQAASISKLSLQFNGDTATNYSYVNINSQGTTAASQIRSTQAYIRDEISSVAPASSGNWGLQVTDILGYAGGTFKSCLMSCNYDANGTGVVGYNVGMWRSTAAINSITIYANNGTTTNYNFSIGTIATLYGIKAA